MMDWEETGQVIGKKIDGDKRIEKSAYQGSLPGDYPTAVMAAAHVLLAHGASAGLLQCRR